MIAMQSEISINDNDYKIDNDEINDYNHNSRGNCCNNNSNNGNDNKSKNSVNKIHNTL